MSVDHQPAPATAPDVAWHGGPASTQNALTVLGERIFGGAPNMLLTSSYVPPAAVACSYLLNRLLAGDRPDTAPNRWRSVFTNSGFESLSTVLKFAKNRNNRLLDGRRERITVLDVTGNARHALGLSVPGLHAASRENVHVCDDPAEFLTFGGIVGATMIVVADGLTQLEVRSVLASLRKDHPRHGLTAVGVLWDGELLDHLGELAADADIVFLGEALSGNTIPVGSVSTREHLFALWNNPVDSIAHISTFGCNGMAMALSLQTLQDCVSVEDYDRDAVQAILDEPRVKQARQRMHANPWQARLIELAGLDFQFIRAHGVTYQCAEGDFVDLGSGAGTAFRGHNAVDLLPDFDGLHGATDRLRAELKDLTGLGTLLPAVSGASSVDKAILTALAARPGRPTVLTATGNFSGKGTLSVALSRTSSFFKDRDTDAFAPHPYQILECPLDDPQAWTAALQREDVALVWMEPAQGIDCEPIPEEILQLVAAHRSAGGYLVGFDECFTGYWRGDATSFLMTGDRGVDPDIVAVAKSMSDGIVPVGAALVRESVFDAVRANAPELAEWLLVSYSSDLTAYFAGQALVAGRRGAAHNAMVVEALEACLRASERSPMFRQSSRVGLLGRLTLTSRLDWLTRDHTVREYLEAVVSRRIADKHGAITLQMRLVPSTAGAFTRDLTDKLRELEAHLPDFSFSDFLAGVVGSVVRAVGNEAAVFTTQRRLRAQDQGRPRPA